MPYYRTPLALILISLALLLGACASSETDRTRNWSAERLYDEAKRAMEGADFEEAIELFEILEARHPFSDLAMQAQLDLAYSYYRFDENDAAIQAAERFIRLHPTHEAVAYAYYLRGLVRYERGRKILNNVWARDMAQLDQQNLQRAFNDFRTIVREHPDSAYADDARQRMVYLRNQMARHEYQVAEFYLERSAYTAAINRVEYLLDNYDRAPVVPDALALQIQAYNEMGMSDRAAEARRVLQANWPDHPAVVSN